MKNALCEMSGLAAIASLVALACSGEDTPGATSAGATTGAASTTGGGASGTVATSTMASSTGATNTSGGGATSAATTDSGTTGAVLPTAEEATAECNGLPTRAIGDGTFTVTSAEFQNCMPIPAAHTCDQKAFPQGTSPSLTWSAGPEGTMSYAVVLLDIKILSTLAPEEANYNRGFHYVMWDIPATVTSLPASMSGGHLSTEVPGARQWSNFNDYGYFGPCPNFDPEMPPAAFDSYAFVVYALPTSVSTIPAPEEGISTVRQMDDAFKAVALAAAEVRTISAAQSSEIPEGVLPPVTNPPCPTEGTPPEGCLMGAQ